MTSYEKLYKYAFPKRTKDKSRRKCYKIVTKHLIFENLYTTATLASRSVQPLLQDTSALHQTDRHTDHATGQQQ